MNTDERGLFFAISLPKNVEPDDETSPRVTILHSSAQHRASRKPGTARGRLWMSPDFQAPMDELFDFLETSEEDL
jgi:hypothetical protein